jgi:hypothetical protein
VKANHERRWQILQQSPIRCGKWLRFVRIPRAQIDVHSSRLGIILFIVPKKKQDSCSVRNMVMLVVMVQTLISKVPALLSRAMNNGATSLSNVQHQVSLPHCFVLCILEERFCKS